MRGALQARAKQKELPQVDHSTISYPSFRKSFYIEVPELKSMSEALDKMKRSLGFRTLKAVADNKEATKKKVMKDVWRKGDMAFR